MILTRISLKNFRNYETLNIALNKNINIIYGQNAQGKTNLLESIYVLAFTRPHLTFIDSNIIKEGNNYSIIQGEIINNKIRNKLEITYQDKIKKIQIDKNEIKKVSEYISKLNVITFYPEDLEIITGSPSIRRNFLNLELSQLYNGYYKILSDYNKLLKIRNDYLKKTQQNQKIDNNYFEIITEYLIDKSIFIYKLRKKFIDKLNEKIGKIYLKISNNDNFYIKYISLYEDISDIDMKFKLKKLYKKENKKEIKLGMTIIGPHRDEIDFFLENKSLKNYGSQGQKRIAVLSLKLAEIEIFKKYTKTNPILLLDDVFSELDINKRNKLLTYINKNIQTIITTTDLNDLNEKLIAKSKIFYIKDGKVTKEVEKYGKKN